jgi:hypothetical protein
MKEWRETSARCPVTPIAKLGPDQRHELAHTFAGWLSMRDTDAAETPARRATSHRVAMAETIEMSRENGHSSAEP